MSQLKELIENSRANEAIARKLFEIETEILASQSSNELLKTLLSLIKTKFNLTDIHLLYAESSDLTFSFFNPDSFAQKSADWKKYYVSAVEPSVLNSFHQDKAPLLFNDLSQVSNILPANIATQANSAAFIPLIIEGKLFGSLVFADNDSDRFHPGLGTYHLQQLAVKVSLCLSNVLIREQLEYTANFDQLTKVGNRRLLEQTLEQELKRHQRYHVPFSILFIDCDKFKQINDTYGHACGDQVLAFVAENINMLIRENDACFRYAGDEFVVMLASQGLHDALKVAKRLTLHFFEQQMTYQGEVLSINISCGVATSDGKKAIDLLLKEADEQLYLHKHRMLTYDSV